jgi:hypothetical protein
LNDASTFNVSRVDFYQIPVLIEFKYIKIFESLFFGIENYFGKRRFNRVKKKELFAKGWQAVHGIPFWQERIIKDMEFLVDKYNHYNEKRNTEMIEFEKIIYQFHNSVSHSQDYESRELYRHIHNLRLKWNLLPNSIAPEVINDNLVEPILKLCENNPLEHAQMIRFCLTSASLQFENMKRLINNYKKQFNNYAEHFETFSTYLDSALIGITSFKIY